jgi:hypothetical protein
MSFVQKIDFVLTREQAENLLKDSKFNAIRLSLGVDKMAKISLKAYGIKRDGMSLPDDDEKDEGVVVCPVPPDCAG